MHEPEGGEPLGLLMVHVWPPEDVTANDVAAEPVAAPVTVTVTCPSPALAVGCTGASGADCGAGPEDVGVTCDEALDAELVPPPLVAVAVNVYGVLFVRLVTVHVPDRGVPLRLVMVQVRLSGLDVTVNEVGVLPVALAVTVTATAAFCETPVGVCGVFGAGGCGVVDDEAEELPLVPKLFVAVAVNV